MKLNGNFRKSTQSGFSLLELLIVVAIILVIAAIAIPNLMSAKRAANQSSAVGSLRAIANAEQSYRSNQTVPTFAPALSDLGTNDAANNNEPYMDAKWVAVAPAGVNGYKFTAVGDTSTFLTIATPQDPASGGFDYCTTQKGTLHKAAGGGISDLASCDAAPVLSN